MKKLTVLFLITAFCLIMTSPAFAADYSLEDYLALVQQNNKDLLIAAANLKQATETEKLARSQALPTIGLSASLNKNFLEVEQATPVESKPGGGALIYKDVVVNTDYDFSFGLGLSQQLFNINVLNAIRASKEYRNMSQSVYDAQNDAIITAAKKVFFQCFLLEKFYDIKKQTEDRAYDHYMLMKKKYETGVVSKLAFLNSEVDWKMAVPETTNARMNLELCLINLKNLAGIAQEEEVNLTGDMSVFPDMPENVELEQVMESRPDYLALMKEKSLRELNIKANMANHFPTLSLDASYGYSAADDKFSKTFNENDKQVCKVGLTLSLPVYTGGALSAQDRTVKLDAETTELKIRKKREDIMSELRKIYLSLQREFENIALAETTMTTAHQAYDIAETAFDNGVMTQLELKDVRVNLESAELQQISSVYNYLCAYFDWQKATGNM